TLTHQIRLHPHPKANANVNATTATPAPISNVARENCNLAENLDDRYHFRLCGSGPHMAKTTATIIVSDVFVRMPFMLIVRFHATPPSDHINSGNPIASIQS